MGRSKDSVAIFKLAWKRKQQLFQTTVGVIRNSVRLTQILLAYIITSCHAIYHHPYSNSVKPSQNVM